MKIARFRRGLVSLALIALVLLQSVGAGAWGNEGHTLINRVRRRKFPPACRGFSGARALRLLISGLSPIGGAVPPNLR